MSVNSYLSSLSSDLIISTTEKDSIKKSIDGLETRLQNYFRTNHKISDKFVFGSYPRETILPRKADDDSDIDYMVVFEDAKDYKPQTCLNWLKDFVETYYSTSEIHQSSPTIVLELNHIKFELVPAYKDYWGTYFIPGKDNNWMSTDPNSFNQKLVDANKNNEFMIKRAIRLIKYWNVKKCSHYFASYEIEKKIVAQFGSKDYYCSNIYDYTLKCFSVIDTYFLSSDISSKISTAKSNMKKALEEEQQGYPVTAEATIKKVFPEV